MSAITTTEPIAEVQSRIIGFLKTELGSGVFVSATSPNKSTPMPAVTVSLQGGGDDNWLGQGEGGVVESGAVVTAASGNKTFVYEPLVRLECWHKERRLVVDKIASKVQYLFETKKNVLLSSGLTIMRVEGASYVGFSDSLLNAYRTLVFARIRTNIVW